jgi:hypothetical protein
MISPLTKMAPARLENAGGLEPAYARSELMSDSITEREKACIRHFAKLFENGERLWVTTWHDFSLDGAKLKENEFRALMSMMTGIGVIDRIGYGNDDRVSFYLTHVAVQKARELEKLELESIEPEDLVEKIQNAARQSRALAWVIISFFVVTAAATLINQTIQIFQNIGWMAKP